MKTVLHIDNDIITKEGGGGIITYDIERVCMISQEWILQMAQQCQHVDKSRFLDKSLDIFAMYYCVFGLLKAILYKQHIKALDEV